MADFSNLDFQFRHGQREDLDYVSQKDRTFNICVDSGELFIDIEGRRINVASNIITGMTELEILAIITPLNGKIYYAKDTSNLWGFDFSTMEWKQVAGEEVKIAKRAKADMLNQPLLSTYVKDLRVDTDNKIYIVNGDSQERNTPINLNTGSTTVSGIGKLYAADGNNTDGSMTQKAITKLVSDTDTAIREIIAQINSFEIVILGAEEDLPDEGEDYTIYFVPEEPVESPQGSMVNNYEEYIWLSSIGYYEQIGLTTANLSNYYTKGEMDTTIGNLIDDIESTYIKDLSVSGTTITMTYGNDNTDTITTQDTTYNQATDSTLGLVKLYTSSGNAEDGTITQKGITDSLSTKVNNDSSLFVKSLSISGKVITITQGDDSSSTITTQDTTYETGTASVSGLTKLYDSTGTATDGTMTQNAIKTALDGKLDALATAAAATKDGSDQNIADTYIKGLSASGKVITYTKGDGTSDTINTQDTTYSQATDSTLGLVKLYTSTGQDTDGTMTRKAITLALADKLDTQATAAAANKDGSDQNIADTYIKNLSVSGTTITFTFGDGDTDTINTQDTTYSTGTSSVAGLTKLYSSTGEDTDGTMTRKAITSALNGKMDTTPSAFSIDCGDEDE